MKKVFLLPEEVLKELVEYLAKRPWHEVVQGIEKLLKLEEYVPPKVEEDGSD